jgi:rhodanese-related sulfurtransferase
MKKFVTAFALAAAFVAPVSFAQTDAAKKPDAEAHAYTAKTPKLKRAEVDQWLAHPDKVVFVDLRRPDELIAIGGLPVYLSIQSKELEKHIAYIPTDRSIITISNHAGRAGKGADLLASKGLKVVGALGVQDYEAEGGTLIKITKPERKPETDGAKK